MLRRIFAVPVATLPLLISACGPSLEAFPGKDANLSWHEMASLNLDDGRPQAATEATPDARCIALNSFRYDAATQQITMRSCNGKGIPETAAFRLGDNKKDRLSTEFERLRVRKLNNSMAVCLQVMPGLTRLVVEDKAGNKETFAAVESFIPGASCESPETIDGVFNGAELTRIIADFAHLTRRS